MKKEVSEIVWYRVDELLVFSNELVVYYCGFIGFKYYMVFLFVIFFNKWIDKKWFIYVKRVSFFFGVIVWKVKNNLLLVGFGFLV